MTKIFATDIVPLVCQPLLWLPVEKQLVFRFLSISQNYKCQEVPKNSKYWADLLELFENITAVQFF